MSDVKLLPCPSGHADGATRSPRSNGAYWELVCKADECGWAVIEDTEASAIAAWNTRALTPKQQAAEEMAKALKACQLQLLQSNNTTEYAEEALGMARSALAKAGQQ